MHALHKARKFYTEGAHSKSVATLYLSLPHPTGITAGTLLGGEDEYNHDVTGVVYLDVPQGATQILFEYSIVEANPSKPCQVGARPVGDQIVNGCLRHQGAIKTNGSGMTAYTYDPYTDNNNGRILQSFSMMARNIMYECKDCPYADFLKVRNELVLSVCRYLCCYHCLTLITFSNPVPRILRQDQLC
jgi:hypothetical protein